MQRLVILALLCLAAFGMAGCAAKPYTGGQPELLKNALAKAHENGKPILIDVFATW